MNDTPQYEPITGELLEVLKGDCQDVIDFAAKEFQRNLKFDDESIVWLSEFIESARDSMSPESRRSWSLRIGVYLGFAIIHHHGGEWVRTGDEPPAVRFPSGAMAFPIGKASKQFKNGIEDNIYGLYRNMGRLLQGEFGSDLTSNPGSKGVTRKAKWWEFWKT